MNSLERLEKRIREREILKQKRQEKAEARKSKVFLTEEQKSRSAYWLKYRDKLKARQDKIQKEKAWRRLDARPGYIKQHVAAQEAAEAITKRLREENRRRLTSAGFLWSRP